MWYNDQPVRIVRLFETAKELAWKVGTLQGSGLTVPKDLSSAYEKTQDLLWDELEQQHGECTCERADYVGCPTFDIHSRLWCELDDIEDAARFFGPAAK